MKTIARILLIGLFFCLIALGLISCGSRKVNKEKIKEETKTELTDNSKTEKQSETNFKTTTTVNTDDKNETVTEETILEPKDETKESFVIEKDGTKVVLNNVKKTVRKTTQKNNMAVVSNIESTENKNNSFKEQKKVKQANTSKKKIKPKQIYKKQFNPFVTICIGLFGLILLWCVYRFYKKLPLVPKL